MPILSHLKNDPNLQPIWIDTNDGVVEWVPPHQEFFELEADDESEINSYMDALQNEFPILKGKECKAIYCFETEVVLLVSKKIEKSLTNVDYVHQDCWPYTD